MEVKKEMPNNNGNGTVIWEFPFYNQVILPFINPLIQSATKGQQQAVPIPPFIL